MSTPTQSNKKLSQETLTDATKKRLIRDITEIYKNPLNDQGIFYIHDDTNMLKGYAMIIGPKDTPYEHGFYFFEFDFPYNYPFSPPKLTYHTNDGVTRFNPNLYRNGKVCLSILNTWRGESWSSCQTISSVLLTIAGTVLNEEPILNEPGIKKTHPDFENYNTVLKYKTFKAAILGVMNKTIASTISTHFHSFMIDYLKTHKEDIMADIQKHKQLFENKCKISVESSEEGGGVVSNEIIGTNEYKNKNIVKSVYISLYNFKVIIKYSSLCNEMKTFLDTL